MAITYGNRVAVQTSTTGTGTITLGSVVSAAYLTFSEAGISDGATVHYLISEGSDFEIGQGTYTASGTTLSRDTVYNSKISGTAGTTKMTLGGGAEVRVIASAASFTDFAAGWQLLNETTVSVSAAEVEWDNTVITSGFEEFFISIWDFQHDSGGTDGISIAVSFDNGSNYSSSANMTSLAASSNYFFASSTITRNENSVLYIYSGNYNASARATAAATAPLAGVGLNGRVFLLPDGETIDAIKIVCNAGANITAGTFQIWGR